MKKRLIVSSIALLIAIFALPTTAITQRQGERWISSWATAPQETPPLDSGFAPPFAEGFDNQTIRNIVHTTVGGSAVRVLLTNAFGTQPVTFSAAYIGLVQTGATLVSGSNHALTFRGSASITIPVGAEALSDALSLAVPAESNLAVSLFAETATGTPTIHLFAHQTTYVAAGNVAVSEDASSFASEATSWYFLRGVDVLASPRVKGGIVAVGDSITDGDGSTAEMNRRWPDFLARRFLSGSPGLEMSVLNAGIGANRVLNGSPCFGLSATDRVERAILGQTGLRYVILMEGITDILFPNLGFVFVCLDPNPDVSADEIIAGYEEIIAKVHAKGLKIIGGTITPFKGAVFGWTPELEAKREAVNSFIKTGGAFDGVIDFAAAVADRNDPTMLAPQFNSGDNLHPNDAGYEAMANAIDLSLFLPAK